MATRAFFGPFWSPILFLAHQGYFIRRFHLRTDELRCLTSHHVENVGCISNFNCAKVKWWERERLRERERGLQVKELKFNVTKNVKLPHFWTDTLREPIFKASKEKEQSRVYFGWKVKFLCWPKTDRLPSGCPPTEDVPRPLARPPPTYATG